MTDFTKEGAPVTATHDAQVAAVDHETGQVDLRWNDGEHDYRAQHTGCSGITPGPGDAVTKGQTIGYVGRGGVELVLLVDGIAVDDAEGYLAGKDTDGDGDTDDAEA